VRLIFKICPRDEWGAATAAGVYEGSERDRRDGFIHFSTPAQLAETLVKHYARQHDLLLVAVHADARGLNLKWEPAPNGDLFPHLYGTLPISAVSRVHPLAVAPDGTHIIPLEAIP
jgi:uncharacterized protein (DUF952 family)